MPPIHLLSPHPSLSHITGSLEDQTGFAVVSTVKSDSHYKVLALPYRLSDNDMELRCKKGADPAQHKIQNQRKSAFCLYHMTKAKQDKNNFLLHLLLNCGAK